MFSKNLHNHGDERSFSRQSKRLQELSECLIYPQSPEIKGFYKRFENAKVLLIGDVLSDHVLAEVRVFPKEPAHLHRVGRFREKTVLLEVFYTLAGFHVELLRPGGQQLLLMLDRH